MHTDLWHTGHYAQDYGDESEALSVLQEYLKNRS